MFYQSYWSWEPVSYLFFVHYLQLYSSKCSVLSKVVWELITSCLGRTEVCWLGPLLLLLNENETHLEQETNSLEEDLYCHLLTPILWTLMNRFRNWSLSVKVSFSVSMSLVKLLPFWSKNVRNVNIIYLSRSWHANHFWEVLIFRNTEWYFQDGDGWLNFSKITGTPASPNANHDLFLSF